MALAFSAVTAQAQVQTKTFPEYIDTAPEASTPLSGSEIMPIIQDGVTKKIAPGSGALGMLQNASNADLPTAAENLGQPAVSVVIFGADPTGVADSTTALQDALAWSASSGIPLTLGGASDVFKITQSLVVPSNAKIIGGGRLFLPNANFNCQDPKDPIDGGCRYASNAVGLNVSGQKSAPYTPKENIVLDGFKIQYERNDSLKRYTDAITCQNVKNLTIRNLEIYDFPVAHGIHCSSLTGNWSINNNYIHDFYNNDTTWLAGVYAQITGIEIDNDVINSVQSNGGNVTNNTIVSLLQGPAALAAYGMQTDGITSVHSIATEITDNYIEEVGEGVDTFGTFQKVSRNFVKTAWNACIALKHGASKNIVSENNLQRCFIGGISLNPDSDPGHDTNDNVIANNYITNIDPDGVFVAASSTAAIRMIMNPDGGANNNIIIGNRLDPGPNGKWAFTSNTTGSGNVVFGNRASNGVTGLYQSVSGDTKFTGVTLASALTTNNANEIDLANPIPSPRTASAFWQFNANGASLPVPNTRPAWAAADGSQTLPTVISAGTSSALQFWRANNTLASPSALANGNTIFSISARGRDDVDYSNPQLSIVAQTTEDWTSTAHGVRGILQATPNSSTTTQNELSWQNGIQIGAPAGGSKGVGTLNLAGDLYNNNTAPTGTGGYVRANSPTLVTPNLDTPTALTLTNATGLPVVGGGTGASTARGAAANLNTPFILCRSAVAVTTPADTSEDVVATCTVPANAMGANGQLQVVARFTTAGAGGNRTPAIRWGGAAGTIIQTIALGTTNTAFEVSGTIANRNATNSQVMSGAWISKASGAGINTVNTTDTLDTTSSRDIVISCQKANAGDTCTLEHYRVILESTGS